MKLYCSQGGCPLSEDANKKKNNQKNLLAITSFLTAILYLITNYMNVLEPPWIGILEAAKI